MVDDSNNNDEEFDLFVEGTQLAPYLQGGLQLGNTFVPYFATSLSVPIATTNIHMPSNLPGSEDVPILLEELFQRELDEDRVKKEIIKYLKRPDGLHFFNSLTAIIFPLADRGSRKIANDYGSSSDQTPSINMGGYDREEIGPVLLLRRGNRPEGLISWNPNFAQAIALDGQHRLHALKLAMREPTRTARELANSHISVLFIILDERAGYKQDDSDQPRGLFAVSRQIFTDLNQKAVTIPKTRLLLLSDEDLVAVSLREILAPDVRSGENRTVAERLAETGRLPLGLVDWHSDFARFDQSYYLTSLLALRTVVEKVLELDLPSVVADYTVDADYKTLEAEYKKYRDFLNRAEQRLSLGDSPTIDVGRIRRRIQRCEERKLPFEFLNDEIKVMAQQFHHKYGARITRPLTELQPYAHLISEYESEGILGTKREAWLSYDKAGRDVLEVELEVELAQQDRGLTENILDKIQSDVKPEGLAFHVVFQQASLLVINSLVNYNKAIAKHWSLGKNSEDSVLSAAIERWNIIFPQALRTTGRESVFLGAGVRAGGTVDYRKNSVDWIVGFMAYGLLCPIEWYTERRPTDTAIKSWLSSGWEEIRPGRKSADMKHLLSAHGKFWRNGIREVLTEEGRDAEDETQVLDYGRQQLDKLIQAARGTGEVNIHALSPTL